MACHVIEYNVHSLMLLDVKTESYGSLLSFLLMNKLLWELMLIGSLKFGDTDMWDLTGLLKAIEEEVQAWEWSFVCSVHESLRPPKTQATGAPLLIDTALFWCCFFQWGHLPQDCQTIVGVESYHKIHVHVLRKIGKCHTCLGKGHVSWNCRNKSDASAAKEDIT